MPRDEQVRSRDKKINKMGRDGLVEINSATGEEERISQRGQDFELKRTMPGQQSFAGWDVPATHPHGKILFESEGNASPDVSPEVSEANFAENHPNITNSPNTNQPVAPPHPPRPKRAPTYTPPESSVGVNSWTQADVHIVHDEHQAMKPRSRLMIEEEPATEPPQNTGKTHNGAASSRNADVAADADPSRRRGRRASDNIVVDTNPKDDMAATPTERTRLRFDKETPASAPTAHALQHGSSYARKFAESTAETGVEPARQQPIHAPSDTTGATAASGGNVVSTDGSPGHTIPKLQFTADELPPESLGNKLTNARRRAERADVKLEKARKKLPTRRTVSLKNQMDPETGQIQHRLSFEKEVKPQGEQMKGPLVLRPAKAAGNTAIGFAHKKMYEVEEENVGAKASHRSEMAAEGGARSALRYSKTRPYRRVEKLQHKSVQANVKLAYQKALEDNLPDGHRPKMNSNPLSRMMQRQKIKRQYARAKREAQRAGQAAKETGNLAVRATKAVAGFVRKHPVAAVIIILLLALVFIVMTMFSSCSNLAGGGVSAFLMSSYTAADGDINGAELAYRQWETDLQYQINNVEDDRPGYDEYRYNLDGIGHDPFELMAYLTAKYQDFAFADVESALRAIFEEQYTLTFEPETETRTRQVQKTRPVYDPDTDAQIGTETYQETDSYEWRILNITLTTKPFTDLLADQMDSGQWEHYNLLVDSQGNRQQVFSPFAFDWHPYISCHFGSRIHPITGAPDHHLAVDIAVPEGTPIMAAHDGTVVTSTWHDSYGYYIAIDGGNGLVTKYAHCSQLIAPAGAVVRQGDVIALVGTTGDSTGPHLHFEVIKDGVHINPLYFAESANGTP